SGRTAFPAAPPHEARLASSAIAANPYAEVTARKLRHFVMSFLTELRSSTRGRPLCTQASPNAAGDWQHRGALLDQGCNVPRGLVAREPEPELRSSGARKTASWHASARADSCKHESVRETSPLVTPGDHASPPPSAADAPSARRRWRARAPDPDAGFVRA